MAEGGSTPPKEGVHKFYIHTDVDDETTAVRTNRETTKTEPSAMETGSLSDPAGLSQDEEAGGIVQEMEQMNLGERTSDSGQTMGSDGARPKSSAQELESIWSDIHQPNGCRRSPPLDITKIPATPHVTVTADNRMPDRAEESTDIPSHFDKNEDVFNIEAELELKLRQGWERKTNKTIGPEGGDIELPDCSLKIPTGAIEAKEDIGIATCSQPEDFPSNLLPISPVLKGSPAIKFKESVVVSMETWYTACENEEILAKIMHRDQPGQAWTSQGEIALTTVNRVEFSISHFSDTVVAVSDDTAATSGEHHMINDVYVQQETGKVVSIFFRDQKCHEEQQKILENRKFTGALALPEEICVHYGSTIHLRVWCEKPEGIKIAKGKPRPQLKIDVEFLQKSYIATYFMPTGNSISCDDYPLIMGYEIKINEEEPLQFPLTITRPTKTTSSTNEIQIHAINAATDGGQIICTSKRQRNKIKVIPDKRRKTKE